MSSESSYRNLPSVDDLASEFRSALPWPILTSLARDVIEVGRGEIAAGERPDLHGMMRSEIRTMKRNSGVRVINATGVLLHTNLGRAPWARVAARSASETGLHYTNLELDLGTGERGRRGGYTEFLLRMLTGAEDALVVNNNAGAVVLALAAVSEGRAVPVSRGELIEIGGAYRLPEVMGASGARLIEVGTTNRTRLGDYQTALQVNECGAVLKVHPSNYAVVGYVSEADTGQLAGLAHSRGVPLIHDIGSGLLDETTPWLEGRPPPWLSGEPGARQSIEAGSDLVTFSGDKLLGGPQAGMIIGTREAVAALRAHPLARALRVDGATLASLQSTLEAHAAGDVSGIPFWRMATAEVADIRARAEHLKSQAGGRVVDGSSAIGAGSAPNAAIPSAHLVLDGEDHLFERLLELDAPVVARRESGALVVDLRTVDPEDDQEVADGIAECR